MSVTAQSLVARLINPAELEEIEVSTSLDGDDLVRLRLFLQDLSLDSATFYGRYGRTQTQFIDELHRVSQSSENGLPFQPSVYNLLQLFARSIELSSSPDMNLHGVAATELSKLELLVSEADDIGRLIQTVYQIPDVVENYALDWTTVRFHRLGTTSLIFTIEERLQHSRLILKVSHVLFTTVGPIADATDSYFRDWRTYSLSCPYIERVWGSGRGWILAEFVDGETLRDFVDRRYELMSTTEQITAGRDIFYAVCVAVDALHRATGGRVGHGDLNPSNILISEHPTDRMGPVRQGMKYCARFIDMGRNLLASTEIGRVRAADTVFVAPEVLNLSPQVRFSEANADFYSLGHLIGVCFGYLEVDGFYFLDERLFSDSPDLARVAANLSSERAENRREYARSLAVASDNQTETYTDATAVGLHVERLAEILQYTIVHRRGVTPIVQSILFNAFGSYGPFSDALTFLRGVSRQRRVLPGVTIVGSLRTVVAGISYLAIIALILAIAIGGTLSAGRDIGQLASDPLDGRIQAYVVSFTYAVSSYQFGTRAFGNITFLRSSGAPRALVLITEIFLWTSSIVVLPLVVIIVLVGYSAWPWCVAFGMVTISCNNISILLLRRRIESLIRRDSERLKWFQASRVNQFGDTEILQYWTPTLVAFTSYVVILAILHYPFHYLQDLLLDAFGLSLINVVVLTWSQVWRQGPKLRANLSQYMVAGEIVSRGSRP